MGSFYCSGLGFYCQALPSRTIVGGAIQNFVVTVIAIELKVDNVQAANSLQLTKLERGNYGTGTWSGCSA